MACDVTAAVGSVSATKTGAYSYKSALTPVITEVSPRRGGTGGGTSLTIKGTGFAYVILMTYFTLTYFTYGLTLPT